MKWTIGLVAAVTMGSALPAIASTFTLNNIDAHCVSGPCVDLTSGSGRGIANNLGAGAVYGVTDPSFIDGNNNAYAARVTVVATGGPANANHSSINVSPLNAWIHYRFEFVESFDENTRTFGANTTVQGAQYVNIEDIDSNLGADFTDVAAVNLPLFGLGSALEVGGFEARTTDAPTPGPAFTFVRLPEMNGRWDYAANILGTAPQAERNSVTASFGGVGDLAGFEFIWGSTGSNSGGNVRGWDVSISAAPTVAPIPVPAALPLLLTAFAGVGLMRRRAARAA